MDRMLESQQNNTATESSGTENGSDHNTEHTVSTEIEQPTPSIATPGIPEELPVREMK